MKINGMMHGGKNAACIFLWRECEGDEEVLKGGGEGNRKPVRTEQALKRSTYRQKKEKGRKKA